MSEQNQPEDTIIGKDLIGLIQKLTHYESKKTFTVYIDMDNTCPNYSAAEISQAEQKGQDEVLRRLQPMRETWKTLRDSLYESGVLFTDPVRGVGIKAELELTEEQKQIYKKLDAIINKTKTFVRVY